MIRSFAQHAPLTATPKTATMPQRRPTTLLLASPVRMRKRSQKHSFRSRPSRSSTPGSPRRSPGSSNRKMCLNRTPPLPDSLPMWSRTKASWLSDLGFPSRWCKTFRSVRRSRLKQAVRQLSAPSLKFPLRLMHRPACSILRRA